eukprot:scaffold1487_cov116-Isochrysis_galbana.AAC.9
MLVAAPQPVADHVGVARRQEEVVPLPAVLGVAQEGGVHRLGEDGARVLYLQVEVLGNLGNLLAGGGNAVDLVRRLDLHNAGVLRHRGATGGRGRARGGPTPAVPLPPVAARLVARHPGELVPDGDAIQLIARAQLRLARAVGLNVRVLRPVVQHQLDHRVVLAVLDQALRGLGAPRGRAVLVRVAPERLYDAGENRRLARAVGAHDEVHVRPKVDVEMRVRLEVGERQ